MSNTRKPRAPRAQAVDFDKLSAERGRVLGTLKPIKIGGKNYKLPPKVSLAVSEMVEAGAAETATDEPGKISVKLNKMVEVLAELFGESQWAEIRLVIDYPDVPLLFNTVFSIYGESVGEASPSGES